MVGEISGKGFHSLAVRNKPNFLRRIMFELVGNSRMSLEGNLSRCRFTDDVIVTDEETSALKRSTIAPRLDFIVLRLTPETVVPILKQVDTAGMKSAIVHVQIERDGVLEFRSYDHFAAGCVVTGPAISTKLLEELKSVNELRDFKIAESVK